MTNNGQPRRPEPAGQPVHPNEQLAREQLQRKIAGAEKQMRDDHMLLVAVINKCATAFERIATSLEKMEAREANNESKIRMGAEASIKHIDGVG